MKRLQQDAFATHINDAFFPSLLLTFTTDETIQKDSKLLWISVFRRNNANAANVMNIDKK